MKQVELLRHVVDNLEAGRNEGYGLVLCKGNLRVNSVHFRNPELYELAPRTRVINGVEVPAPMDKEPERFTRCWTEAPQFVELCEWFPWTGRESDNRLLALGLCYDSPEAAVANCRARYGIAP